MVKRRRAVTGYVSSVSTGTLLFNLLLSPIEHKESTLLYLHTLHTMATFVKKRHYKCVVRSTEMSTIYLLIENITAKSIQNVE